MIRKSNNLYIVSLECINIGFFFAKDRQKILDEEVARLHLSKLGVTLTEMTDEQAEYIGIPKGGPYKPEHYRY